MFSVSLSYYIKPSASVEIPNPAAAEDITRSVPKFIQDPKSGKFFESWYNEHKYVLTVNFAKWDGKKFPFSNSYWTAFFPVFRFSHGENRSTFLSCHG
ncbi:unnamed protein product [Hymenolepis diminuta]|uniref:Uncharacterized protein n=1 Tax=Hymenolepis diminuta TaxID=6216 RepID=A0A564Z498_HYMDI|nr:unnamed protein product [Hymenolepis diminuta]